MWDILQHAYGRMRASTTAAGHEEGQLLRIAARIGQCGGRRGTAAPPGHTSTRTRARWTTQRAMRGPGSGPSHARPDTQEHDYPLEDCISPWLSFDPALAGVETRLGNVTWVQFLRRNLPPLAFLLFCFLKLHHISAPMRISICRQTRPRGRWV